MNAQPSNFLVSQAVQNLRAGNLTMSERLLQEALRVDPDSFDALHTLGVLYSMQGRPVQAVPMFRRAVARNAASGLAHFNLAVALSTIGDSRGALPCYERAAQLSPRDPDVWVNYGVCLFALERYAEAVDCYEQALSLDSNHVAALVNQGAALAKLLRHTEALEQLERARELNPAQPAIWANLGMALRALHRPDDALAYFDRALHLDNAHAETWSHKANALFDLMRYDEALVHYERALQLESDNPDVWYNKGYTQSRLKQFAAALESFDRAISLAPGNADTWYKKANTLIEMRRHDEALLCFDEAVGINPDCEYLLGDRLSSKMAVCNWTDTERQTQELIENVLQGRNAATPFTLLSVCDDPAVHQIAALRYAEKFPEDASLGQLSKRVPGPKIRIGYFSNDFHMHATAFLTVGVFESHDRGLFEITAFSFGPNRSDEMRLRLASAFDQFIDVSGRSCKEIAQIARDHEIDIAVDLQGYQTQHRTGIFACRAAPIQVSYLAYPGTMGTSYIDYLIADRMVVPDEMRNQFSEKIVYLPDTYQPNDGHRAISSKRFTRQELGLPDDAFVFCCFNTSYKITPEVFGGWMNILRASDNSVLWLYDGGSEVVRNLRAAAVRHGIAPDRLVFAGYMDLPEHLSRHRAADLFLDTFPYGAHTTASDALWAGLPVLTRNGASFASRVASSLLKAVHMPELMVSSQSEYERLAIELAASSSRIAHLKQRLAAQLPKVPLFDTVRYTSKLEAAYQAMYQRYQADLSPEAIVIE